MIVDFRRTPPDPPPPSHWLYCKKDPAETVFPSPAKGVQPATGTAETILLCHHRDCPVFIYNCLVWFSYLNRHQKNNGESGLLRGLSVPLCPASKNFTHPERRKGLIKSLWTPHTQLTLSMNCCPLAGVTNHWAPKPPDTRTVFPPGCIPPEQHITHLSTVHL